MAITEDRLRQTFSEGGAQEIYQEVKASNGFLGFARQYAFSQDYLVARSALWGVPWHSICLHETHLPYVQVLPRTDGRTEAHT